MPLLRSLRNCHIIFQFSFPWLLRTWTWWKFPTFLKNSSLMFYKTIVSCFFAPIYSFNLFSWIILFHLAFKYWNAWRLSLNISTLITQYSSLRWAFHLLSLHIDYLSILTPLLSSRSWSSRSLLIFLFGDLKDIPNLICTRLLVNFSILSCKYGILLLLLSLINGTTFYLHLWKPES